MSILPAFLNDSLLVKAPRISNNDKRSALLDYSHVCMFVPRLNIT